MNWFGRKRRARLPYVVPAPGAVLTFVGTISRLATLVDARPRFVDVGYVDVMGEKARKSALVDALWPEGDHVRIEFVDRNVPDLTVGSDEEITFHIVDIDRPDLDQKTVDNLIVRMEPRL